MALSADGNQRQDQVGETVVGQSIARARDGVCMDQLRQVRLGVQTAMTSSETPPATLQELRLPSTMLACPIGKEPYQYNPADGSVKCTHPGHEKY